MLSCWKYSVDAIYSVMHLFIIVLNILCKIKSQYKKNSWFCPFTKLKNLFYTKKYTYTKISVHLMFNNFCMSLLPMHKKQNHLFFISDVLFILFEICLSFRIYIVHVHASQHWFKCFFFYFSYSTTSTNEKTISIKIIENKMSNERVVLLNGKLTNQDNDCFTLMRCKNCDTLCSTSIYIHTTEIDAVSLFSSTVNTAELTKIVNFTDRIKYK